MSEWRSYREIIKKSNESEEESGEKIKDKELL